MNDFRSAGRQEVGRYECVKACSWFRAAGFGPQKKASHRSRRRCGMSCAKAPTPATHTTVMEHAFDRSQMKKLKKEAEEVTDLDGKAARVSSRHV